MDFYIGSVVLDQYIRALYLEKEDLSALSLVHHPRNALECQYLALSVHGLQTSKVSLKSVRNKGHLILRA